MTAVGNAQISTARSIYGGSSGLFDGSGDWVATPVNSQFNIAGISFTIELWVYLVSRPSGAGFNEAMTLLSTQSGVTGWAVSQYPSGVITFVRNGSSSGGATTGIIPLNTWTYLAFTGNGTTVSSFVGGVASGTGSQSHSNSTGPLHVGALNQGGYVYSLNGNLAHIRLTRNVVRDVSVVPTEPFPAS